MKIDLEGRIALVTGATGNLGPAMARTLGRCGAFVVIHYGSNTEKAQALAEELKSLGAESIIAQGNIQEADTFPRIREMVKARRGPIDIVVTNAVTQVYPWRGVLEEAPEDYQDQFASCVMQNVYAAKAFCPEMIERKYGRFIGINTECTMECRPKNSAYVSGKRGMDGVLRCLAKEVGPYNITVNQVAPGWMKNESQADNPPKDEAYIRGVPMNRRGSDQEIANAVAFLASDLAGFIHGAFLPVCGGRIMPTV